MNKMRIRLTVRGSVRLFYFILIHEHPQGEDRTPERPFVTENNVIMYLDMIHEKIAELKGVAQYLDWKKGIRTPVSPLSPAAPMQQGKGAPAFKGAPLSPVRREPSANQLIGTAGWLSYHFPYASTS